MILSKEDKFVTFFNTMTCELASLTIMQVMSCYTLFIIINGVVCKYKNTSVCIYVYIFTDQSLFV